MGLFKKKSSGNDEQYSSVVKNSGAAGLLIWRYPEETFKVNTPLIVMPGEQALFIKNGEIVQAFDNGSYTLSPEEYSFIRRLLNKLTGKVYTFDCVVYFVNAADTRELLWGTQTPIQVRDRVYGIRTDVKARGAYKIRITEPAAFLKRLVGSNVDYRDDEVLDDYFAEEFQGKIKAAVSGLLNSLERELIGIDEYADELSQKIKPRIDEAVGEYGLSCVSFSISGLDVDISKYDAIDESQMSAVAAEKKAQGDRRAMDILGDGWEKQQSAELLAELVKGAPAEIAASGTAVGLARMISPETRAAEKPDVAVTLTKLKELFDAGLITESEYAAKKAQILERIK